VVHCTLGNLGILPNRWVVMFVALLKTIGVIPSSVMSAGLTVFVTGVVSVHMQKFQGSSLGGYILEASPPVNSNWCWKITNDFGVSKYFSDLGFVLNVGPIGYWRLHKLRPLLELRRALTKGGE